MGDAFIAPVWLGATLLLVWAAWLVSRRLFPDDAVGPHLMHTTVLSWACIVGVSILLGSVGWLSPGLLLAGVGALAGLAWRHCRRVQAAFLETALPKPPGAGLAVFAAKSRFAYAWMALWSLTLAWAVSWTVWAGLLRFPDNWDTLNYHLPLIAQWLHRRNLYAPDGPIWFVPGNNELLGLWLVGPFSGDFLIAMINLPAALLLATGTVELARSLGLAAIWRHLTALAVLASWPVLQQLTDVENDVAVAGSFVVVLAYSVRYARQGKRADLILAAISLGLLAGVKYYALGYACVAAVGLLLLVLAMRGWKATGEATLMLALGVCFWGGYWYVRNLWVAGSPIYPQGLLASNDPLGHMRISTGQTALWQTTLLGNGQAEVFPLLRQAIWRMAGPCHSAAFWLLPVTLVWLAAFGIWRSCHAESSGFLRLTLAFWVVATGLVWGVTPFAAEDARGTLGSVRGGYHPVRYGLCFLNLCVLGSVLAVNDLSQMLRRLLRIILDPADTTRAFPVSLRSFITVVLDTTLMCLILTAFGGVVVYQYSAVLERRQLRTSLIDPSLLAVDLWLIGGIVAILWSTLPRLRRMLLTTLTMGLAVGAALATAWLSEHWHAGFATHYDSAYGYRFFTTLEKMDPSTTCVCTMDDRCYPFFGSRRQLRVCQPYWAPSYASLLDYLHNHEVTLVIAPPNDRPNYHGKGDWLRAHPALFPPIDDSSVHFVYRVDRCQLASALEGR